MEIVKDKNILMISQEAGKAYKIDLSTLTMYGITGRLLKNLPKPLQDSDTQYLLSVSSGIEARLAFAVVQACENSLLFHNRERTIQALSLFERFLAVDLKPNSLLDIYYHIDSFANVKLDGELIAYAIKEHNGKINKDVLTAYNMRAFREKYPLDDSQYQQIMCIYDCTNSMEFTEFMAVNVLYRFVEEIDNWRNYACKFFQMAKDLEKDWRKEKFMFDAYCRYSVEHRAWQDKEIDRKIMLHYNEKLAFENDTFMVVIPKTGQEIRQEGRSNRNCVSSYVNSVADNQTIIVFVRYKNNPEKSFITCEIRPNTLRIVQFLEKFNYSPCKEALRFKQEYQNYLSTLR